jgi:plastocyanin
MRTLSRAFALGTLLFPAALLLAGCGGGSGGTEPAGPAPEPVRPESHAMPNPAARPAEARAPEAPAEPHQVVIDQFTFSPRTLTIAAGTRVTWLNRDDVPHTATSTGKPRVFDSGTLDSEERFSHVFTMPGTYAYYCTLHPKMTGQIFVK